MGAAPLTPLPRGLVKVFREMLAAMRCCILAARLSGVVPSSRAAAGATVRCQVGTQGMRTVGWRGVYYRSARGAGVGAGAGAGTRRAGAGAAVGTCVAGAGPELGVGGGWRTRGAGLGSGARGARAQFEGGVTSSRIQVRAMAKGAKAGGSKKGGDADASAAAAAASAAAAAAGAKLRLLEVTVVETLVKKSRFVARAAPVDGRGLHSSTS